MNSFAKAEWMTPVQGVGNQTKALNGGSIPEQQHNVAFMQALTTLRDEEPAFDDAIRIHQRLAGDIVATAEDLAHKMYVLMSGRVNLVCTNSEGRRLVVSTLEPGSVFGEGALEVLHDPNIFVEASDNCAVWVIPSSEARNMTTQYPILGWGLLQTYGERLLQVENSLENVAYKKLPERLASLLIDLNERYDGHIRGVSHQTLADYLGTYRETVSAILRDFKRQNFVELGYRRIQITDEESLRDIAGIWDW